MNRPSVIIRCRVNNTIGFGHLVRSRVLASKFVEIGYRVILVGPNKKYMKDKDHLLFNKWIEREEWFDSKTEAKYHITLAKKYETKYMIMDDYRSDYDHQLFLRQAGLKILQQYDASKPQKFAAHLVVNGSPYEKREFYEEGLYSKDIQMLHGPHYAILREEFLDKALQEIQRKDQLLVTFGGGDDHGAISYVLSEIVDILPSGWNIVIVVGEHHPYIEEIKNQIQPLKQKRVSLMVNPLSMPHVIAESRLAILSGGTTTFEAAYLGVPAILMPIAENQYNQGKGWDMLGAMYYLKPFKNVKEKELRNIFREIVSDENKINCMSNIAKRMVDGKGAYRLIRHLLGQKK